MADAFLRLVNSGAKFSAPKSINSTQTGDSIKLQGRPTTVNNTVNNSTHVRQKFDFFGTSKTKSTSASADSSRANAKEEEHAEEDDEDDDEDMYDEDEDEYSAYETDAAPLSLKELQEQYEISVKGFMIPKLQDSFTAMQAHCGIPSKYIRTLYGNESTGGFGFRNPTPAQMQSIPVLMQNRELQLYAPTGSGKTISFVLPMLALLENKPKGGEYSNYIDSVTSALESKKPRAKYDVHPKKPVNVLPYRGIILAPTKELAFQTYKVMKKLTPSDDKWYITMLTKDSKRKVKKTLETVDVGGSKKAKSTKKKSEEEEEEVVDDDDDDDDEEEDDDDNEDDSAQVVQDMTSSEQSIPTNDTHNTHRRILITTPMSLATILVQSNVIMPYVRMVVIDEADRLFDMGFIEQVDCILGRCVNPSIQRILCSATISSQVEELASRILRDPVRVVIGGRNVAQANVKQRLVYVGNEDGKSLAIRQQMTEGLNVPMLIFVQSKERAMQVYDEFKYENIKIGAILSDMTADQRLDVMNDFRVGKIWVLVCTDVLARGIDFKHVNCVINFDFPQSIASYIHRIGRTGRAGRRGEAITFVTDQDKVLLPEIAEIVRDSAIAQKYGYAASTKTALKNKLDLSDIEVDCPQWMLDLPKSSKKAIKQLAEKAPVRHNINTDNKAERREEKAKKRKRLGKIQSKSVFTSRGEQGTSKMIPKRKSETERQEHAKKKMVRRVKRQKAKRFKQMQD